MTKRDCLTLITMVSVAFPSYLKGLTDAEKMLALNQWMEFMGDIDAELGVLAVREYLHTARQQYQSDNVPLIIQDIAKEIRRETVKEFGGFRKFAVPEVNQWINEKIRQKRKAVAGKPKAKALPQQVRDSSFARTLASEGLIDSRLISGGATDGKANET